MNPSILSPLLLFFLLLLTLSSAQPSTTDPPGPDAPVSFRPSIAVVIGIFSIMFSLTLLLLMYAKFCHSATQDIFRSRPSLADGPLAFPDPGGAQLSSGMDKAIIDLLPFFSFSSLKGSRSGLECAVCISKFDDPDLLRLLPDCNHAFHLPCIDRWLLSHSTCPLCRRPVDAPAAAASGRLDGAGLFVERSDDNNGEEDHSLHKFKHRIIVSDVVFRSRWSDVNSSDLLSLDSDMLRVLSSRRLEESGAKGFEKGSSFENASGSDSRSLISPGHRCMSEMTNVTRFQVVRSSAEEEKVRRVWLPIARRTVQWFAGRERRPPAVGDSNIV